MGCVDSRESRAEDLASRMQPAQTLMTPGSNGPRSVKGNRAPAMLHGAGRPPRAPPASGRRPPPRGYDAEAAWRPSAGRNRVHAIPQDARLPRGGHHLAPASLPTMADEPRGHEDTRTRGHEPRGRGNRAGPGAPPATHLQHTVPGAVGDSRTPSARDRQRGSAAASPSYAARRAARTTCLPVLPPGINVPVVSTAHVHKGEDGRKHINQYVVLRTLGRGSSGKVKLVQNSQDGKSYALKVLMRSSLCKARGKRTGFDDVHTEIVATCSIDHTSVMRLYEAIDDPKCDKLFLVLEYVGGGPVMKGYVNTTPFKEREARLLFRDLANALICVHSQGVVHRDIKPENLLRCDSTTTGGGGPYLKISDFGEAHIIGPGEDDSVRCTGGTPAFHAPECCSSTTFSGFAADVWAAGVSLYVMTLGRCPYIATTIMDMYRQVVNDEPDFSPDGHHISASLTDLLSQLLNKDASRRISLQQALEHPWCTMT